MTSKSEAPEGTCMELTIVTGVWGARMIWLDLGASLSSGSLKETSKIQDIKHIPSLQSIFVS
jgi:hypothetical protein